MKLHNSVLFQIIALNLLSVGGVYLPLRDLRCNGNKIPEGCRCCEADTAPAPFTPDKQLLAQCLLGTRHKECIW